MGFGKNRSALKTSNDTITNAAQLTLRQSIYPLILVTSLFFLWVSPLCLDLIVVVFAIEAAYAVLVFLAM